MTRICFIDTETTSLRHDRRAWEVAVIVRNEVRVAHPDRPDTHEDGEHHWFIDADDLDLGNADPMALKIGRFHDRHPQYRSSGERGLLYANPEAVVMREVEAVTRGAHLVGAVPNFDADVLGTRMRVHGICPSWHYHLIDVEALTVGYFHGLDAHGHSSTTCAENCGDGQRPGPPWKSDDLSAALGIKVSDEDRHTALGDAKWARAIYDAVTGVR